MILPHKIKVLIKELFANFEDIIFRNGDKKFQQKKIKKLRKKVFEEYEI